MKVSPRRMGMAVVGFSLIAVMAGGARADVQLAFNQNVSQFDPNGSSGEPTGGFETTTNTDNGDLIGLRASARFSPVGLSQTNDGTVATYYTTTGLSQAPPTDAAVWNFDYIFAPGAGNSLSDYTLTLSLTGLDGTTQSGVSLMGAPLYPTNGNVVGTTVQDSVNPGYVNEGLVSNGYPPLPITVYDPNTPGTYTFTLTLTPNSGDLPTLSESIIIDVVPEPSTFALGVSALAFLGCGWWRHRVTAAREATVRNQV